MIHIDKEDIVQGAIVFAAVAHKGANRKGTSIPYIVHPVEVLKIVSSITDESEVRAAAVLHDTVEDTGTTLEELEELFGKEVADLVASESEKKMDDGSERPWKDRKQETIDRITKAGKNTRIVCLGDKLANMRDIARDYKRIGDALWERFTVPDDGKGSNGKKDNEGWYYRSVADRLKGELSGTEAWQELDGLIVSVFGLESCE